MSDPSEAADSKKGTLFATDFFVLYAALDAELAEGDDVDVVIVGGAAVIPQWMHRGSFDVDVISKSLTPVAREAIARIGRQHGVAENWLNDAARISTPNLPYDLTLLYEGNRFRVFLPDNEYLLATKLFAAREVDIDDTILLARDTGTVDLEDMLDLLQRAWPNHLLEPRHRYFAESIAERLAEEALTPTSVDLMKQAKPPAVGKPRLEPPSL